MVRVEVTLWDGRTEEVILSAVDKSNLLYDSVIKSEMNCLNGDIRSVHIKGMRAKNILDFSLFRNLERVEFNKDNVVGLHRIYLTSGTKYEVVNVPNDIESLGCSSYSNISNMDELLKNNVEVLMR